MKDSIQLKTLLLLLILKYSSAARADYCETGGSFKNTPEGCQHLGLVWGTGEAKKMNPMEAAAFCSNFRVKP